MRIQMSKQKHIDFFVIVEQCLRIWPCPSKISYTEEEDGPINPWYIKEKRCTVILLRPTKLFLNPSASPNTSKGSRSSTTIPQQALWFLNNDFLRQVVTRVRSRLEKQEFEKGQQQVSYLYSLFYSRTPEPFELETALDFLANSEGHDPLSDLIQVLLMSNEFVYVN